MSKFIETGNRNTKWLVNLSSILGIFKNNEGFAVIEASNDWLLETDEKFEDFKKRLDIVVDNGVEP